MPIPPAVHVVTARLDPPPAAVRECWLRLSADEQDRASRFRFERDRRRFIVARARLRQLLAQRLGAAPESIHLAYGPQGKPALASRFASSGWRFNLSRRAELAFYAFSRASEVGVDVEPVQPLPEADALAAHAFSAEEERTYLAFAPEARPLAFLRCWTRKEALAKALGVGLTKEADPPPGWRVHSFCPRPGFIAALAYR
jgi:4'-phosphopantetheinyl transferase